MPELLGDDGVGVAMKGPALTAGEELDEVRKPDFYASAAGTLFPSDWPEPFGLVMIESMAAGTPVIALRRGSVPEIVRHGVTGFICDTVDEMVVAVGRLGDIDPEAFKRQAKGFDGAHEPGLRTALQENQHRSAKSNGSRFIPRPSSFCGMTHMATVCTEMVDR